MKLARTLLIGIALLATVSVATGQSLVTVYSHDFDTPVGNEWTDDSRTTSPSLTRTFLGRFGGEQVTLNLDDLPDHCSVTISFDLLIIGSWEGSVGYNAGADIFDLQAFTDDLCCPVQNLLHTTFANCSCKFQAYPAEFPDVHNPGLTGADEIDTLGYDRDSVYNLSFTFFHDADILSFRFGGSPNLQRLSDESWGIDNLRVDIDSDQRYCCRATRTLPTVYGAGFPVPVAIDLRLDPHAQAHVVEEAPPAGWIITDINDGGIYEAATGLVKWGPFFGAQARTLTYTATPQTSASGDKTFEGTMTVDGETEVICGDTTVAPGSYHPADLDSDWELEGSELTSYAAAWRAGDPWTREPNPVPADYVTNAGVLWRSGETYHYSPSNAPPWAPVAKSASVAAGLVESTLSDYTYTPGSPIVVTILATPDTSVTAFAVEDRPPLGWTVSSIGQDGVLDRRTNTIRWGLFLDHQQRTLSYTVVPAIGAEGTHVFDGLGSFDGSSLPITGQRTLGPPAFAGPRFVVPAAAHTEGDGDTAWRTDLGIHNPTSVQATYTIALLEAGADNSSPRTITFTLNPGTSVRYQDALDSLFSFNGAGALLVTASEAQVLISSRTYTVSADGSFGQAIPGRPIGEALTAGQSARLVQLSHSAETSRGFRTNIGLASASETATTVHIDIYSGEGVLLGDRDVELEPYGYTQIGGIFAPVSERDVDDGYVVVHSDDQGARYFAYASVVDNVSGDPSYIEAR